jgi:hypothetical protein
MSTTTTLNVVLSEVQEIPEGSTEIDVPNTGILSGSNTGIFFGGFAILVVAAFVISRLIKHKNSTNFHIKKKKTLAVSLLAILVLPALVNVLNNLSLNQTNSASAIRAATLTDDLLEVTATSAGTLTLDAGILGTEELAYVKDTITVSEEVSGPYTIYLTASDNKLVHESNSNLVIPSITEPGALTDKSFGYTIGNPAEQQDITWNPVTTEKTAIIKSDASLKDKTFDVYYAVRAKDLDIAGTYKLDLNYTLTIDFDGTMQGMNSAVCERMELETPYYLEDTRDGKGYYVGRLQDDNCWMVDALALDLPDGTELGSDDTDLHDKDEWTPNIGMRYEIGDNSYFDEAGRIPYVDPCDYVSYEEYESCHEQTDYSWRERDNYYSYSWNAATAHSPRDGLGYGGSELELVSKMQESTSVSALAKEQSQTVLLAKGDYGRAKDSICARKWHLPTTYDVEKLRDIYDYDDGGGGALKGGGSASKDVEPQIVHKNNYGASAGSEKLRRLSEEFNWAIGIGRLILADALPIFGDSVEGVFCVSTFTGYAKLTINDATDTGVSEELRAIYPENGEVTFTIPETAPVRDGYTFMGYSATHGGVYLPDGSEPIYQPGEEYIFDQPFITLHPVWLATVPNVTYMQDFSGSTCYRLATNKTYILFDERDDQAYSIRKLSDGDCWMTKDLNFKLSSNTTLTPDDTDLYEPWTPSRQIANSVLSPFDGVRFYTWNAATAESSIEDSAYQSICPAGWSLPFAMDYRGIFSDIELYSNNVYGILDPNFNPTFAGGYDMIWANGEYVPGEYLSSDYSDHSSQYLTGDYGSYFEGFKSVNPEIINGHLRLNRFDENAEKGLFVLRCKVDADNGLK